MDKKGTQGGVVNLKELAQDLVGRFQYAPPPALQAAKYKADIICKLVLCVCKELQRNVIGSGDDLITIDDFAGIPNDDGAFKSLVLRDVLSEQVGGLYPEICELAFYREYVRVRSMADDTVQQKSYEDAVVFLLRWLYVQVFLVETAHLTYASLGDNMFFPRLEALMQSLFFPGVDVGARELQRMLGLSYDLDFLCKDIKALGLNNYTHNALIELFKPVVPSVAMLATLPKKFRATRFGFKCERELLEKLGENNLTMGMKFPPEVADWLKAKGVTLYES